jgi:transketolase
MGRHKVPVLTKEDGTLFYDEKYEYLYGSVDRIREGSDITVVASGTIIHEVMKAKEMAPDISMDILVASSIKQFDETLKESLTKTGKVITVEDHNTLSGLGSQVAKYIVEQGIHTDACIMLGVPEYQLSGTPELLYRNVGIDAENIATVCKKACTK